MKIDREKLIYDLAMQHAAAITAGKIALGKSVSTADTAKSFALAYKEFCTDKAQRFIDEILGVIKDVELADSYVYIYKDTENNITQQSRGLNCAAEKVNLVCTHQNGRYVSKEYISNILSKENLNAHSFRHTRNNADRKRGNTEGSSGKVGTF